MFMRSALFCQYSYEQQKDHTGCSAAVSLTAHPVLLCGTGGKTRHFQGRCKILDESNTAKEVLW
jgi:hypothetical protein